MTRFTFSEGVSTAVEQQYGKQTAGKRAQQRRGELVVVQRREKRWATIRIAMASVP